MSSSQRSIDQKSTSSKDVAETSSLTAAVFSYADFVFASSKRHAEAELFASLVWRTRHDLTEASRLYLSPIVNNFLEAWPDRKSWIDKVLSNIHAALIDIGTHIESVRTARDDDEAAKRRRKFEYTLSHQKRLAQKQQTLANSHQVLLGAIQVMQTVEQCVGLGGAAQDPIFEAPVRPWLQSDSEIIRAPYSRRSKSKNLSALSIAASEMADKYEMRHSQVPLAELPGSTPDDPQNANTSNPPRYTRIQRSHSYDPARSDSATSAHVPFRQINSSMQNDRGSAQPKMSHQSISDSESNQQGVRSDQTDRKSTHASSSLNAVVDRIIERTQSIASTTTSYRMPVLAKRYRPRPIRVQGPYHRYHSLPTKLPPYESQPSLEDGLRDWMIQTSASEYPPEAELTRSPTVSSTTGSIASRHEMMKILASIPNVEEDDQEVNATASAMHTNSIQDNASKYPMPLSAPYSPSLASESAARAQDSAALLSSFPMPPFRSDGLLLASDPEQSQREEPSAAHSQEEAIRAPPTSCHLTAASGTTQICGETSSFSQLQDDVAVAASLLLPPSQPNSPPLPSEAPHQAQRTIRSHHSSSILRKPLPSAMGGALPTRPSPATSLKPKHCVQLTGDGATSKSPSDVQSVSEECKSPKQPNRPPPPPPPPSAMSPSSTPSGPESGHTTSNEAPAHLKHPPPVPFIDALSQVSPESEVHGMLPQIPAALVMDADTDTEAPKPRTAEAKRRAAHARRMKLAFGE